MTFNSVTQYIAGIGCIIAGTIDLAMHLFNTGETIGVGFILAGAIALPETKAPQWLTNVALLAAFVATFRLL